MMITTESTNTARLMFLHFSDKMFHSIYFYPAEKCVSSTYANQFHSVCPPHSL